VRPGINVVDGGGYIKGISHYALLIALGTRKKQMHQSCLSSNPFSVLPQWAHTISMHPLRRL